MIKISLSLGIYTVSREFVDQVRASLPACVVCNKPSGYVDLDGRPSHMVCADESGEERRQAKIESRGGNVARSAGLRDLGAVMRQADEYAVLSPQQRREATLRHIHRNDPPGPRSPELIARMSERSVYDLRDVRVDVFSRDGSSELINRARRAVELGYYPVAGRDQARVMEHVDHLLRAQDQCGLAV
jgi:hypothetical protein